MPSVDIPHWRQSDYTKIWIWECDFRHPGKIHIEDFSQRTLKNNRYRKIFAGTIRYSWKSTKKVCKWCKYKAYSKMLDFHNLNLKESKSYVLPKAELVSVLIPTLWVTEARITWCFTWSFTSSSHLFHKPTFLKWHLETRTEVFYTSVPFQEILTIHAIAN